MAIAAGRRKFFYSFDLVKGVLDRINCLIGREERSLESFEVSTDSSTIAFLGNDRYIMLVSTKTKQLIGTLKMNGTARALSFTDDGRQLLSSGEDGQVYHWDLRMRKCIHRGVCCAVMKFIGISERRLLMAFVTNVLTC
jgi:U3 small nucleolar RNA-associated protein 18